MIFSIQIIISFAVGGLLIGLQTLIGERVSLFWRGVVLTIPTTMAMGFLFIGLTKTPLDVVEVSRIIPAALGPDYIFVMAFALLAQFSLFVSIVGSFLIWAIFGFLLITFPPPTFVSSIFLYGLPLILIAYLVTRKLPQVPHLKQFPMNTKHILFRSVLGGAVVALIVILAKTFGNVWGGLFSAFPAAFTSSLIIYYVLNGKTVVPSVAKSLFFPGSLGFMVYALVAAGTFPRFGIWLGTLISYLGIFLFFYSYFLLKKFGVIKA